MTRNRAMILGVVLLLMGSGCAALAPAGQAMVEAVLPVLQEAGSSILSAAVEELKEQADDAELALAGQLEAARGLLSEQAAKALSGLSEEAKGIFSRLSDLAPAELAKAINDPATAELLAATFGPEIYDRAKADPTLWVALAALIFGTNVIGKRPGKALARMIPGILLDPNGRTATVLKNGLDGTGPGGMLARGSPGPGAGVS